VSTLALLSIALKLDLLSFGAHNFTTPAESRTVLVSLQHMYSPLRTFTWRFFLGGFWKFKVTKAWQWLLFFSNNVSGWNFYSMRGARP
jgi:hypothetical protein